MTRQSIDDATKESIIQKVREGASYSAAAKEHNLNPPQVRKMCIEAGIKSQHKSLRGKAKTEEQPKEEPAQESEEEQNEEQPAEASA